MAKIGLKYPVYAVCGESGTTVTYTGGAVLAKAVSANISITTNDSEFYANDELAESDRSFASGSVTIEIDELANAAQLALLGYTEGAEVDASLASKELIASGTASPAYVGFGFYGKKRVSGASRWRAIWLKKVQFSEPADAMQTKGENIEFGTTSLEGNIMVAADGRWKEEGSFDTEAEAVAYLNAKTGISSEASNNITELTASNGTFTPTFAEATRIYSLACTDNTVLNATFATGTASLYVDGTFVQYLLTTVNAAAIVMGAASNKLIQIVVQESGKSAITYTIAAQRAAG